MMLCESWRVCPSNGLAVGAVAWEFSFVYIHDKNEQKTKWTNQAIKVRY